MAFQADGPVGEGSEAGACVKKAHLQEHTAWSSSAPHLSVSCSPASSSVLSAASSLATLGPNSCLYYPQASQVPQIRVTPL